MAKSKSRKKPLKSKFHRQQLAKAAEELASQKAISVRLVNIFRFMSLLALLLIFISLFRILIMRPALEWWFYVSQVALIVSTVIGVRLQKRVAPDSDVMTQVTKDPTEFRRKASTFLGLLVFQNIAAAFPLLYSLGVITQTANWVQSALPSKPAISDNISIGASFVIATVISSVLGNSAYDILKHFVVRRYRRTGKR